MSGKETNGIVATVGTFDGLHRGHRKVLDTLRRLADEKGGRPMVICFDRHPLETVAPERAPGLIQSPSERTNTLYTEGFEILTLEFTPELAGLTAEEWLRKMRDTHGVGTLVIGYDNTFGCDGINMSISDYQHLGERLGVAVVEAPVAPGVSSSAIRKKVGAGLFDEASEMLGRHYTLVGKVVHGQHIGTGMGFPTANIQPSYRAQLPPDGVYAAEAVLPDGERHRAVVNIGKRPTVEENGSRSVEAHLIGYDGDLYGKRLALRFIGKIRSEIKFDSLEQLSAQIQNDIQEAKKIPLNKINQQQI